MKKFIPALYFILLLQQVSFSTTYYSKNSVDPNTELNWNTARNGLGINAPVGAFANPNNIFVIQGAGNGGNTPHQMQTIGFWMINGANSELQIEGNGGTLICAHNVTLQRVTVLFGGQLTNNAGVILTINDGNLLGADLSVSGTYTNAGTTTYGAGATGIFNADGEYKHNFTTTAGTIPLATWDVNSYCTIQGYTTNTDAPGNMNQLFGYLKWNCAAQTNDINADGNLTTVNRDLTITNTNTGSFRLCAGTSPILNIGGNLKVQSGIFSLCSGAGSPVVNVTGDVFMTGGTLNLGITTSQTVSVKLSVNGNVNVNAGTLDLKGNNATGINTLEVAGNLGMGSGTLTQTCSTTGSEGVIKFTGAPSVWTAGGTFTNTYINTVVNNGASLTLNFGFPIASLRSLTVNGTMSCGDFVVSGAGDFTLASSGTLKSGSVTGIDGNITNTGAKTFTDGAGFVFNGTAGQTTGASFPSAFTGPLTFSNTGSGVTLSQSTSTTGTLTMTSGIFTLGSNNISAGAFSGGSSATYISTNGTGKVTRTGLTNGASVTFPIGKSSYNPVTLTNTSGPTEDFTVNVQNTLDNSPSGSPNHTVLKQWNLSEATAGGNTVSLVLQWNTGDEDISFVRATSYIGHWNGASYDATSGVLGGSLGIWTITASGFSSFSPYIIGDDAVLPVELSAFTSSINGRNVNLKWTTNSEINNSGFDIERKKATTLWSQIGFVAGIGNSNVSHNYDFSDKNLQTGNYNYRLKQIDNNGNFKYYNLSNEVIIGVPGKFNLSQNYPNPFNPVTKINFSLPKDTRVTLNIYDINGREAGKLLNNEFRPAGYYTAEFNASKFASGVYFYRLTTDEYIETKKMLLVK